MLGSGVRRRKGRVVMGSERVSAALLGDVSAGPQAEPVQRPRLRRLSGPESYES